MTSGKIRELLCDLTVDAICICDARIVRVIVGLDQAETLLVTMQNTYISTTDKKIHNIFTRLNSKDELSEDLSLQEIINLEVLKTIGIDLDCAQHALFSVLEESGKKIIDISQVIAAKIKKKSNSELFKLKCAAEVTEKILRRTLISLQEIYTLPKRIENTFMSICGAAGFRDFHINVTVLNPSLLSIDCGIAFQGYYSDITRMISLGPVCQDLQNYYSFLQSVCQYAAQSIIAGMNIKELFLVLNWHYRKQPMFRKIKNGFGHGIGLKLHEGNSLFSSEDWIFEENQTFTIEPILKTEFGNLRLENMYAIQDGKATRLNTLLSDDIVVINPVNRDDSYSWVQLNPMVRVYNKNDSAILANLDIDALCSGAEPCYRINEKASTVLKAVIEKRSFSDIVNEFSGDIIGLEDYLHFLLQRGILLGGK